MIDEFQRLLDQYLAWLKDKTTLRQVKDWVEITMLYLDRHNDYLQICAKRENGAYLLTDGGETIEALRLSGCTLDSPRRQELLRTTLNGFGVKLNNNALEVRASTDHLALRKHNLVQAMLAVNDLFFVTSPIAKSLCYEDVVAWLEAQQIRYIPNVKFTGKSGYDHLFDFAIPKSHRQPERILQALNRPRPSLLPSHGMTRATCGLAGLCAAQRFRTSDRK
jgi:Domain of unknown function DUF1828/Domain of unknown function DUF1829